MPITGKQRTIVCIWHVVISKCQPEAQLLRKKSEHLNLILANWRDLQELNHKWFNDVLWDWWKKKVYFKFPLLPELPVGGAQPELPVPSQLSSALLLLFLVHVLFIVLFLAAGTGDRPATTTTTTATSAAARHYGRTWVCTWWVNEFIYLALLGRFYPTVAHFLKVLIYFSLIFYCIGNSWYFKADVAVEIFKVYRNKTTF